MALKVGNKVVLTPIIDILRLLQSQLNNGKLKYIDFSSSDNIKVTCPHHKNGQEKKPSCFILSGDSDKGVPTGTVHCFACGYTANFFQFVSECFGIEGEDFGRNWVIQNAEIGFISPGDELKPIEFTRKKVETLDESVLDTYNHYNDYMWQRKLSKSIVDLFEVGYDKDTDSIVFPVRDENGKLLFITKRSVKTKNFFIPEAVKKPVYLLYYCKENNIERVAVCESQINTLYCWSLGIPAIGLFGTGDDYQYEILNRSGIRIYDTFFDGDEAGDKGFYRFKKSISPDCIINRHILPRGKDVNDLSLDELKILPIR